MKSIIALAFAMLISIPSFANLWVSPGSIHFGTVKVGMGFHQQTAWVRNHSNEAVRVYVSAGCMDFNVTDNCYTLPANGSCTIQVSYRPSFPGYDSCSINVRSNNGSGGFLSVSGNAVK